MGDSERFSWLRDVSIDVEAAAAGPSLRLSDILALTVGTIMPTQLTAGKSIDVFAGGARIGAGEFLLSKRRAAIRMVRFGNDK